MCCGKQARRLLRHPQLAGIMRAGECGRYLVATPIAPYRDWLAETAARLGSPFAL
jgi:hypothetical protein